MIFLFFISHWMMIELVDSPRCSIMIFLGVIFVSLATVGAQERSIDSGLDKPTIKPNWKHGHSTKPFGKTDTVIENKNVNIIVNVDPKDVAKELWNLIQTRLDGRQGRRSLTSQHTMDELEGIITPMMATARRSNGPTAFEVAYALDHFTRKALLGDNRKRSTIDDEIDTREIVARMLFKLKLIMEENDRKNDDEIMNFRRSLGGDNIFPNSDKKINDDDDDADNDDEFIRVTLKIRKSAILRGIVNHPKDDS